MPCNSDYLDANDQEIEYSKVLALLEELKNPTNSNIICTDRIIPGVYLVMVMTENEIYRSKIFIK